MQTPAVPPVPHVGGPITGPGATSTLIGGLPAARVTDLCTCVGPPDSIVKGSPTVLIAGLMAARMGDLTAHGGVISAGFPKVLIGDQGSASGATPMGLGADRARGLAYHRDSQRAALENAASNGTPFCEECEQARLAERASAAQPSPARTALVDAAKTGTPFCEECERARVAEAFTPFPSPARTALADAAGNGTPFCEECERARLALAE